MEVWSSGGMSVSEDLKNLQDFNNLVTYCELSADPDSTPKKNENFGLNDLGSYLNEFLTIQDDLKQKSRFIKPFDDKGQGSRKIEKDDISSDSNLSESVILASEKCLSKCATFPYSIKVVSSKISIDGQEDVKDDLSAASERSIDRQEDVKDDLAAADNDHTKCQCSISLPTKLVSAMKGGREKQGTAPRKLTVKWASDVYDPPPSVLLPVSTSKLQRQKSNSKKSVKNKRKVGGKSSRSNKGKDKTQARKYGGSFKSYFELTEDEESTVDCDERRGNNVDFDVGNRDPFCASIFLGKPVAKLQFPVA